MRAFDPGNNFALVGEIIPITAGLNETVFNNTLFAQDEFVGYVEENQIVKFDVTGITSYPATLTPTITDITGGTGGVNGTPYNTGGATPNDLASAFLLPPGPRT